MEKQVIRLYTQERLFTQSQVTSSESNLQKALDNEDYNCSINKKFDTYNILNCEQESNYTKYQIVFSKELP